MALFVVLKDKMKCNPESQNYLNYLKTMSDESIYQNSKSQIGYETSLINIFLRDYNIDVDLQTLAILGSDIFFCHV